MQLIHYIVGIFLGGLSIYDLRKKKVPLIALILMIVTGLIFWIMNQEVYAFSIQGGVLFGVLFCAFSAVSGEAMGMGDSFLFSVLGFLLGIRVTFFIAIMAFFLSALYSIFILAFCKRKKEMTIAFVPFICASYCLVCFFQYFQGGFLI